MMRAIPAALAAAALAAAPALNAQEGEARFLEAESQPRIEYRLHVHPANAHVLTPAAALAPDTALNAAKLLNLHLSTGDLEEAAVLSTSPKRRFEVLQDYRQSIGEEEFKRVFAQYFDPANRLLAEVAIDKHRLLIWELRGAPGTPSHLAGQYFIEVDGKYLLNDVPDPVRTQLRRVLEAYRAGKLP
ncbi:MAG: hypothetical protein FJY43_00165 [Betaproteobacteria bacterium]|nr:hypothetical protein [Betaproteobacteria bacterium]